MLLPDPAAPLLAPVLVLPVAPVVSVPELPLVPPEAASVPPPVVPLPAIPLVPPLLELLLEPELPTLDPALPVVPGAVPPLVAPELVRAASLVSLRPHAVKDNARATPSAIRCLFMSISLCHVFRRGFACCKESTLRGRRNGRAPKRAGSKRECPRSGELRCRPRVERSSVSLV